MMYERLKSILVVGILTISMVGCSDGINKIQEKAKIEEETTEESNEIGEQEKQNNNTQKNINQQQSQYNQQQSTENNTQENTKPIYTHQQAEQKLWDYLIEIDANVYTAEAIYTEDTVALEIYQRKRGGIDWGSVQMNIYTGEISHHPNDPSISLYYEELTPEEVENFFICSNCGVEIDCMANRCELSDGTVLCPTCYNQ